jgi:hypothetical protein
MTVPELVIAALLPYKAGAIFSIRLWAGMVGGNKSAAWLNPKVTPAISNLPPENPTSLSDRFAERCLQIGLRAVTFRERLGQFALHVKQAALFDQ